MSTTDQRPVSLQQMLILVHSRQQPVPFCKSLALVRLYVPYDCILVCLFLFIASAMCCLYLPQASWLKAFIEDQLIS